MLGGARFGLLAVVPRLERPACLVAVIVAVTDGTCVNKLLFSVYAVKLHDFLSGPRRLFHLPASHRRLDGFSHGSMLNTLRRRPWDINDDINLSAHEKRRPPQVVFPKRREGVDRLQTITSRAPGAVRQEKGLKTRISRLSPNALKVQWCGPQEKVEQEDQLEKEGKSLNETNATIRSRPDTKFGHRHTPRGHSSGAAKNMDVFDHLFMFVIGLLLIEFLAWLEGLPNALTHLAPAAGA